MTDLCCFLAGMTRLLCPLILLIFWHKKTNARLFPAPVAFSICLPVFILAGGIRSGFNHNDYISYYIQQGLLYGIFEEGSKYFVLRYLLESYDNRKDAVTYGIGHSMFENFGAGLACLGLIGADNVNPDILWFNLWSFIEGSAFVISLTVLIFYGIYMGKSIIMLPVAMLIHAVSNASKGIFYIIDIPLTAVLCFAAYCCWQKMQSPYEIE
jgi:uncharacterized membrane protein YhfC